MESEHRKPVDPVADKTRRAFKTMSMSAAGLELGVSVVVGALLGHYLDTVAGTTPWLMILFLVLGTVAGFRSLIRAMHRAEKQDKESDGDA